MLWCFGPFRVDMANACLWHDTQRVAVRPKTFDVLVYLVSHAGELVTKESLLDAVWPETAVGDAVLKVSIRELRQVLGETAKAPQYIATVARRGYCFLAAVTIAAPVATLAAHPTSTPGARAVTRDPGSPEPALSLVGRDAELAQLQMHFARACQGERQVVSITGEAGIGKSTLVDALVTGLASTADVWLGRDQCIEQYGVGEPYLPLLEALGRLARGPQGARLVEVLRQQAPSWLVHLPALVTPEESAALQLRVGRATSERMLRELAEAIETLTAVSPLLLVLEDLHWSDVSTIAWLAYVARRRDPARLFVLGTYRSVEAMRHNHPVRTVMQELQQQGQGSQLVLGYFTEASVTAYLTQRYGHSSLATHVSRLLHQRTSGHPLFLVTVVETLVRQGALREGAAGWELVGGLEAAVRDVPDSLRQFIEQQFEQLPAAEQAILEAASVAGVDFAAAAVASEVDQAVEDVEAQCDALARRGQFLQARGTTAWPDATVTAQYRFGHTLYQEVLYARVPACRRVRWHQHIGARLEAGYGTRAREIATELAVHFVHGRDAGRAARYLQYAGEQALQRSAHQQALQHLRRGLELIADLSDTLAQVQQELDLRVALGPALIATKGFAAPEVEQVYIRARELCEQVGETPHLPSVLLVLCRLYYLRAVFQPARELGEELLSLAQREGDPTHLPEAHQALGSTLYYLGEFPQARIHLEAGLALLVSSPDQELAMPYDPTPRSEYACPCACLSNLAQTLWFLGHPDQALHRCNKLLTFSQGLAHPHNLVGALFYLARLHAFRGERQAAYEQTEALIALATEQGFAYWGALGACVQGWVLALQGQTDEGIARMQQGLTGAIVMGSGVIRLWVLSILAEAYGKVGQIDKGLDLLTEALSTRTEVLNHFLGNVP